MKTLVIDVGTSGVRAAILLEDGSLHDLYYESLPPTSVAPGLVEFDAEKMYESVHRVASSAARGHDVTAVGITCQRASTVVWRQSTGRPVGPALGWQDLRTVGECIMARATHGIAVAPNQTATKAAWIINNLVEENERTSSDLRIGTVDSWLVWKLTNGTTHVTDHSNAAVTGLTNASGTEWNADVCAIFGISPQHLPQIVDSAGFIANAIELAGQPPITAIIGDQQASLVGQGCISNGQAKITFGTGGMLDVFIGDTPPTEQTRRQHGTFPIVAFSRQRKVSYGTEAIMLSAGTNIEWLCTDMGLLSSPEQSHEVASQCDTTDGVMYVPALVGLGTPHWDYGARLSLIHI